MHNIVKFLVFLLITIWLIFVPGPVWADPPGPPTDHGSDGNQNPDPVGAPIDGGLGILIVLTAGAGYGGLKLYKASKKEKEDGELKSNERIG